VGIRIVPSSSQVAVAAAVAGWVTAACAPAPTPPARPAAAGPPAAIATAGAPGGGVTDIAALEAHLTAAGVALEPLGEQNMVYFDPPAHVYQIGPDNLEVHAFPHADLARLAAAGVAPDGRSITAPDGEVIAVQWLGAPHFYLSGPLLVIYVGGDAAVLDALSRALGPPFAGAGAAPGGLASPPSG
jgi:hypothetical protein